jgi:hypothetical protein
MKLCIRNYKTDDQILWIGCRRAISLALSLLKAKASVRKSIITSAPGHDRKFELLILMSAMPAKADVLGFNPKSLLGATFGHRLLSAPIAF